MNKLSLIEQEYLEYIISYGIKFDTDVMTKNTALKIKRHLDLTTFKDLRDLKNPVLCNTRLVTPETLSHILKKVEKVNYLKLKDLFIYKEKVLEDFAEIKYDEEVEKFFERLKRKGFSVGSYSFELPSSLETKDYFNASLKIEEKTNEINKIFESLIELDKTVSLDEVHALREFGARFFDGAILFSSNKKMLQFNVLLEEMRVSEKNYAVSSAKDLHKINFDSAYLTKEKLLEMLSYKNGFRKEQFKIVTHIPQLSDSLRYYQFIQENLKNAID